MSIPKKIHYVWVGGQPKSKDIQACMKTWRKHLGDYEIIEWNEKNFDIDSSLFVRQAYEQKRWAYVSDYIRAYAVYHYGGIYLDTDVLVLDDLTRFLDHRAFVGFENSKYPFTAAFGAEPGHPLVKDMLDFYEGKSFAVVFRIFTRFVKWVFLFLNCYLEFLFIAFIMDNIFFL